jgi:hypothetical protein
MNIHHLLSVLPLTLLHGLLTAQVQVPVNPRATYLRFDTDPLTMPAPAIPISALGLTAGQWVSIATVGAYSDENGPDTSRNLACVFSSNSILAANAPTLVNRVPGALPAGPNARTNPTYWGGSLATDIPQDFWVARNGWTNGTLVQVPAGATHLFLTVADPTYSFFGNNSDPNSDFQAVFTAATPPPFGGTQEHCELRTGIGGTPTATPEVKPASPFSTLNVDVAQRFGDSANSLYLVAATTFPTGGAPPVGPLPGIHMGINFVVVQVGVLTTAPGQWSFFVPPGFPGTTLILQGFFLDGTARNGLLDCSNAHRIELQ